MRNATRPRWIQLKGWALALMVVCVWQVSGVLAKDAAVATSCVGVGDLTCEYLTDPLGIDVAAPRLSWKLTAIDLDAEGQHQSAYRVVVASSIELLDRGEADLWDSGKQASEQSTLATYAGKPLQYGDACYWKVRVWDGRGAVSEWSPAARWTMGPMRPDDWQAKWIGPPDHHFSEELKQDGAPCWDPWLRRGFDLPWTPDRAEISVASVGYHELYVNGHRVSDHVLAPAVSNHRVRARYITYDIAPLLTEGRNVAALWLGAGWSHYPYYRTDDAPIAIARATIHGAGERVSLVTDESWRTRPSPNRLLGGWEFRRFGGEHYDARRETAGWNLASHDDSDWDAANVYEPNLELSAQMVEPNRVAKRLAGTSVTETAPAVYRVDMGRNFAGLLEVDLQAAPGEKVQILSSELPDREQMFSLGSEYVVDESGRGVFRSRFNYHSGRYVTLKGLARRPLPEEVRGLHVRTDFKTAGRFACSNELLNRIHESTLWTFENLSLGGYVVDCPQRERMGYGGDAHATLLTSLGNYSVGAFYTKWSQDWRDCQYPDGYVPNTAPTYWGGGGPGWGGYCVTLPWEIYRRYGDKRILIEQRETIERWLAFVESTSEGNLLTPWRSRDGLPGDEWMFLGDWLWPGAGGPNGHTRETRFFNSCYWVFNLATAARVMDAIGDREAATRYSARADEVRGAIHQEFYDAERHSYVNGQQAYLAIALLAEVTPPSERPQVWRTLEKEILERKNGHIDAGITGGAILFKVLMDAGRNDLIYTMASKTDFPSWGDMLNQGATTIWEAWEGREETGHSRLHSSYLYVGAWPLHGLVGIRPGDEAGFHRFEIAPDEVLLDDLEWVTASYDSDHGLIEFSGKQVDGGYQMTILTPPNTTAELLLPPGFRINGGGEHEALTLAPGRRTFLVVKTVDRVVR